MTPEPFDNEPRDTSSRDNSELAGYWPTETPTEPDCRFDHHDEYPHVADPADPDIDLSELGCDYCLGGFAPAGIHPVLGAVYVTCIHCTDTCRCCTGQGLFPADTTCMRCLDEALTALGHVATFCHSCAGVLTITPTDEVTP